MRQRKWRLSRPRWSHSFQPGVVTVTSTVPLPVGEVAVIEVALTTLTDVAAVPPKFTAVAPVKLVPVTITHAGAAGVRSRCSARPRSPLAPRHVGEAIRRAGRARQAIGVGHRHIDCAAAGGCNRRDRDCALLTVNEGA